MGMEVLLEYWKVLSQVYGDGCKTHKLTKKLKCVLKWLSFMMWQLYLHLRNKQ